MRICNKDHPWVSYEVNDCPVCQAWHAAREEYEALNRALEEIEKLRAKIKRLQAAAKKERGA